MGLGPAAASTAFSADKNVTRFVFRPSVSDYVKTGLFEGFEEEKLSEKEAAEEEILMGLRYKGGLDLKRLSKRVHRDIDLSKLTGIEGFSEKDGFLVPDDKGLMVADAVASRIVDALY